MREHDLKTWLDAFEALWRGEKTAEFRRDDRGFAVGDQLRLNEYDPGTGRYSSRTVVARITHIERGGRFGIPDGYAMLSLGETTNWGPSPLNRMLREILDRDEEMR